MREYAKLAPTFWTGKTGRAIKRRGIEGVVVALYLVSSPHSNMLGLYYQPKLYLAEETGLTIEGACKGLADCIASGFCSYDEETKTVWVHEMAAWQVAEALAPADKRCKGIQKDYDALPDNPFLGQFFDRYAKAFNLTRRREYEGADEPEIEAPQQAPSKPHRSQEQEQEQELFGANAPPAAAPPSPPPEPMTAKDRIWAMGVSLLGEKGRSHVGKLIATYGETALVEVLADATREQPVDPKAWIVAACEARAKAKPPRANGQHQPMTTEDLLNRDPYAEWASQAGFRTIFEAESAGCGPANAHKFRDGRRVA